MRKKINWFAGVAVLSVMLLCMVAHGEIEYVYGEEPVTEGAEAISQEYVYRNDETGYEAIVDDGAGLLKESEKETLLEELKDVTEYSNVAFVSVSVNFASTENFALRYNEDHFYGESGIVFVVDMDNRYIYMDAMGDVRHTITDDYAQTITDNVYTYASDEDYYKCASKAFAQTHSVLEGQWIARPMKYICNAFLAVAIALLINYFLVRMTSRAPKATDRQILGGIFSDIQINNARANFTHQTKRYSPQSSSSGGGGSSRSGGGGGGGHSGGGHRF